MNGYRIFYERRKNHSSIISIPYEKNILKIIESKKIRVAHRGDYIRFSIHFYNTHKDIRTIIEAVKRKTLA